VIRRAQQATLGCAFTVEGIGLHTGRQSRVRVRSAPPGKGIVFRRLTGGPAEDVRATWKNFRRQYLCSGIAGASGVPILTVEHLLAALSVFGIDNAVVELHGNEIPILDGSAQRWCTELERAGVIVQDTPRRSLRVLAPVEARQRNGSFVRIEPAEEFALDVSTSHAPFRPARWRGVPTVATFTDQIAPARSHGPAVGLLAKYAFALTGRADRLRGVGPRTVALTVRRFYIGGMRLPDEPVRHRTLDLIGDLALAGYPLIGAVVARDPHHALNARLVRALMKQRSAWVVEDVASPTIAVMTCGG
jgi:UDP-3-O-[3-hydroxymyristoyl] N-acetylglucosamine deacetylase